MQIFFRDLLVFRGLFYDFYVDFLKKSDFRETIDC